MDLIANIPRYTKSCYYRTEQRGLLQLWDAQKLSARIHRPDASNEPCFDSYIHFLSFFLRQKTLSTLGKIYDTPFGCNETLSLGVKLSLFLQNDLYLSSCKW